MNGSLKITVEDGGKKLPVTPQAGTDYGVVEVEACPNCRETAPVKVVGRGCRLERNGNLAAEALTLCCGATIGVLRGRVDALFRLDEDEAAADDEGGRQ